MGKLPWCKFYYADFLQDTSVLSCAAVGGWMRILCELWHKNDHTIELTEKQLMRLLRAEKSETWETLSELIENNVCNAKVTDGNKKITLTSRRIERELKARDNNRLRQSRFRGNAKSNTGITVQKSEDRSQKTEKEKKKTSSEQSSSPDDFLTIPLKDGTDYLVTPVDIDQWKETFPLVDVPQKLKEIRQWNLDNPQKRKTRRGIQTHISKWLAREQDKPQSQRKKRRDPFEGL
jgi:uncharacterized protein YdaU (DUF1376 family)